MMSGFDDDFFLSPSQNVTPYVSHHEKEFVKVASFYTKEKENASYMKSPTVQPESDDSWTSRKCP